MEDYIDDEKDATEEDVQILNDPTIPKEEEKKEPEEKEEVKEKKKDKKKEKEKESETVEEEPVESKEETTEPEEESYTDALMNKEWLKGIGLDD